jgi:hypothetical protein
MKENFNQKYMKKNVKSLFAALVIVLSVVSCNFFKSEKPATDGIDSTKVTNGDLTDIDSASQQIKIDTTSSVDTVATTH